MKKTYWKCTGLKENLELYWSKFVKIGDIYESKFSISNTYLNLDTEDNPLWVDKDQFTEVTENEYLSKNIKGACERLHINEVTLKPVAYDTPKTKPKYLKWAEGVQDLILMSDE